MAVNGPTSFNFGLALSNVNNGLSFGLTQVGSHLSPNFFCGGLVKGDPFCMDTNTRYEIRCRTIRVYLKV